MPRHIIKKKILPVMLASMIAVSALSYSISAVPSLPYRGSVQVVQTEKTYLALGDSISTGYMLGGGHFTDEAYVNITAARNGYTPVNKAIDGNTVTGILEQIQNGELDADIASADLITITCGGNDMLAFLGDSFTVTLDEIYQNTIDILDDIILALGGEVSETDETETETSQEEPAEEKAEGSGVDMDGMYTLFGSFVTGIDDSLAFVDTAKKNASFWERLMFVVYEGVIDYALDSAESMLIDFTESEEYQTALQEYADTLNTVTEYIRTRNEDVQIVVMTQYNPYQWFDTPACSVIRDFFDAGIRKLNGAIVQNAERGTYRAADVYTAFANSETSLTNAAGKPLELDVHPNAEGHAVIADCLQKLLDEGNKP